MDLPVVSSFVIQTCGTTVGRYLFIVERSVSSFGSRTYEFGVEWKWLERSLSRDDFRCEFAVRGEEAALVAAGTEPRQEFLGAK